MFACTPAYILFQQANCSLIFTLFWVSIHPAAWERVGSFYKHARLCEQTAEPVTKLLNLLLVYWEAVRSLKPMIWATAPFKVIQILLQSNTDKFFPSRQQTWIYDSSWLIPEPSDRADVQAWSGFLKRHGKLWVLDSSLSCQILAVLSCLGWVRTYNLQTEAADGCEHKLKCPKDFPPGHQPFCPSSLISTTTLWFSIYSNSKSACFDYLISIRPYEGQKEADLQHPERRVGWSPRAV